MNAMLIRKNNLSASKERTKGSAIWMRQGNIGELSASALFAKFRLPLEVFFFRS